MLNGVNAKRGAGAVCGGVVYPAVGGLRWNTKLQQAATVHSLDMSNNNFFSHTGSDGSRLGQRISAQGYSYSKVGENIAAGQPDIASVIDDWMNSPSHCSNIMTASFVDLGVSCINSNPSSTYKIYWTMEMGN